MLGTGKNTFRVVQTATLISTNIGAGKRGAEKWIFSGAFRNAAPAGIAREVHHGRKGPANAGCGSFAGCDARGAFGELRIPGGGNPQRNRKFRAKAVNNIETENQGDVEAGFFDCDALKRIVFFCGDNVKKRADFTL